MFENWVLFVAGAEVEDFAFADVPDHAAAEPFVGLPAFFEDNLVRGGYVEGFVVHFGGFDFEGFGETFGDGVLGHRGAHDAGLAVGAEGGKAAVGHVYADVG